MLGQIRAPLVSGDAPVRIRGNYSHWLVPLVAGLVFGALLTSLAMGAVSWLAGSASWPSSLRVALLVGASAVFLVFDLQAVVRGTVSRLGLERQTPQRFKYSSRRRVLAFFWGADIGSGVSTFRVTSAIWVVSLALALGLVPFYVGILYGVGLAVTLSAAILGGIVGSAVGGWLPRFMAARRWMQGFHVVALVSLGVLMVISG